MERVPLSHALVALASLSGVSSTPYSQLTYLVLGECSFEKFAGLGWSEVQTVLSEIMDEESWQDNASVTEFLDSFEV